MADLTEPVMVVSNPERPSEGLPESGEKPLRQSPGQAEAESASWHRLAGIGVEFIASVGVCAAIGYGLDRWLKTPPWLLLVGLGVGFAIGLWQMVKVANRMFR